MELPKYKKKRRRGKALIVEGGGMRGAFTGGVLNMMSRYYPASNFDIVVAVSSGSCSTAYYVTDSGDVTAGLRLLNIWRYELIGKKLISFKHFLKGKRFLNQDYLVDELFGRKYRMKVENFDDPKRTPFYIVVTNTKTLKSEYIRATSDNIFPLLKAATALPIATHGRKKIGDNCYTDGGILDPLPVKTVIDAGYTDITVLTTNPRDFRMKKPVSKLLSWFSYPRNKALAEKLHTVHQKKYNESYELLNSPPEGVKIKVIDPAHGIPADMLTTSEKELNQTVDIGMEIGKRFFEPLRKKHFWERVRNFFARETSS